MPLMGGIRPFRYTAPIVLIKKRSFQVVVLTILFIALISVYPTAHANTQITSTASSNALLNNPSPYLAMHGHDPVHWQTWQAQTLKLAKSQNKLIMISSGYFSCHWCHVMQHENYQDPQTAAYLNQHFIAVKIDRELMPDLDAYLINFAQTASGHAGWPEHVFLTPEGYPFFALTYQPRPNFLNTLQRIETVWQQKPAMIQQGAKQAVPHTKESSSSPETTLLLTANDFNQALESQLTPQQDSLSGGLKDSVKFPNAPILNTLLQLPTLRSDTIDWLNLTLTQMQNEHLQDHIDDGFFRYTIDPEWQTPHFEKMLYTQALLAKAYLLAAQKFRRDDYLATAKTTLNYAETHLFNAKTQLFESSESAVDQNQIEGGNALYTQAELKARLSSIELDQVTQEWRLNAPAPFEIHVHQNGSNPIGAWLPKPTSKYWPQIRQKLLRPQTQIPKDTKSILGWNGLMLSTYAIAVTSTPATDNTEKAHYQQMGQQLANRLISISKQSQPPRALSFDNQPMGRANLQDYAFVIQGLKDWQIIAPSAEITAAIHQVLKSAEHKFLTSQGWLYSDAPLLPGQQGSWLIEDNAIPSPTAIMSCGQPQQLARIQTQLQQNPLAYASYSQALTCAVEKP